MVEDNKAMALNDLISDNSKLTKENEQLLAELNQTKANLNSIANAYENLKIEKDALILQIRQMKYQMGSNNG